MKRYPESFNTQIHNVIDTTCYRIEVSNYGLKKSSFVFFTPSERYVKVKETIILKNSPNAVIKISKGKFVFKSS